MKAVVCTAYGPPEVLRLKEVEPPRLRRNGICIHLFATAVTASDCIVRGLKLRGRYRLFMRVAFGFRAPRRGIIGMVLAGTIESVGRNVTLFKPGDEVFGIGKGSFAEYARASENKLEAKPANLSF